MLEPNRSSFAPDDATPEPAAGASNTTVVALSAADATAPCSISRTWRGT
ncbi:hypothetical protein N9L68_03110 [bacterium]|nr:hypothetical protein [bacterium]